MRNLPVFSGIVLFALMQPDFSVIPFQDQTSQTQPIADIASLVTTDTLRFCVDYGNAELPSNNQTFLGEGHPDASSCSVHIWTTQEVTDPCGGSVMYSVRIYPFSGVDAIQVIDSREVQLDSSQHASLSFDTRDNSLPSNHPIRTSGLAYTSRNCDGVPGVDAYHLMEWTISNACGDTTFITHYLKIDDCIDPQAVCVGLSSVVLPGSGSVTIWAKDFENSSFDDCTTHENLLFSFNRSTYVPSLVFDCASVEAHGGPSFLIEIWVADDGRDQNCNGFVQPLGIEWDERNKNVCTTFLIIDDNEHACDSSGSFSTRITTPKGEGIKEVRVDLVHFGVTVYHVFTDQDGFYTLENFNNPLLTVLVVPHKNDDPKNGVSTLDLIRLQKHLFGTQIFNSPFEYIAADANNSENVSALDLVEIRKLILGLYTEFHKSESWRFVNESHVFPDPLDPWPFAEVVEYNDDGFNGNFLGVKIGDVNGSAMGGMTEIHARSTGESWELLIEDRDVKAGETITVPVYAKAIEDILGFQFTLQTKGLEYIGIEAGDLDVSSECIGVHDDAITMSWANLGTSGLNLGTSEGLTSVSRAEDPLFTLNFATKSSCLLSEMLKITSNITHAEAYIPKVPAISVAANVPATLVADDIYITDVTLHFTANEFAGTGYALYQNIPNPFSDQTVIGFVLPEAMPATLTVYDLHGRVIYEIQGHYDQGFNEIILKGKELNVADAYYYRLNAGDFTLSKKLILSRE